MKKKGRKKGSRRANDNRRLWVTLGVVLCLLVCAVAILVFFELHREKLNRWLVPETKRTEKKPLTLDDFNQRLDRELESIFREYRIDLKEAPTQSERRTAGDKSYVFKRIEIPVAGEKSASELKERVRGKLWNLPYSRLLIREEISEREKRTTLNIGMGQVVTRQVVLIPGAGALVRKRVPRTGARVAIIVDDIGQDLRPVADLLSLGVPLTFSILPGLDHSEDAARMIHNHQREILLHLPMEPLNYGKDRIGADTLTVDMSIPEIRDRVDHLLSTVPYLSGVNNHMGSRFTQDRERITAALQVIKNRGLFFVDSLTIGNSVAFEASRDIGLKAGKRDIFLDHNGQVLEIKSQIDRLIELAKKTGTAIAICHPRPNTIEALRQGLLRIKAEGIEIVPVSELTGVS